MVSTALVGCSTDSAESSEPAVTIKSEVSSANNDPCQLLAVQHTLDSLGVPDSPQRAREVLAAYANFYEGVVAATTTESTDELEVTNGVATLRDLANDESTTDIAQSPLGDPRFTVPASRLLAQLTQRCAQTVAGSTTIATTGETA